MNNKLLIIIAIIVIAIVCIFSFTVGTLESNNIKKEEDIFTRAQDESSKITSDIKQSFSKISVDEYLDYYNGSSDTLILVGRAGCKYCQIAEPIIQNIMYLYDINIKYLSTDDFDIDSEEKFMNSNEMLNSFSTPLLMVVSNSTIKDSYEGLTDTDGYIKFFEANGYIYK